MLLVQPIRKIVYGNGYCGGWNGFSCVLRWMCFTSFGALRGASRSNGMCLHPGLLLSRRPPFLQRAFRLHLAVLASHLLQKHLISVASAAALWAIHGECMCSHRH